MGVSEVRSTQLTVLGAPRGDLEAGMVQLPVSCAMCVWAVYATAATSAIV